HLEQFGNLVRPLEFLPSNEDLLLRQQGGRGLTRPELSVLLAYCKTMLKSEILASDVPEDKYIAHELVGAFPEVLRERYSEQMKS
ncbi:MAG TPA: NAD-glutamate dehydrogenase, partial [Candidatus Berkiella sp.]|nr:NAD-glutamate dehydrogenase [Candidatus Berkiella sp.]